MKPATHTGFGSKAGRGWQPRMSRSALLFWWPAALLVLLTGGLWLLWPHGHYGGKGRPMRLPEPGAAYVTLAEGAQSLYLKLDIFTSPSGLGFGRSQGGLDAREMAPLRVPPPPDLLPAPVEGPWRLALTVPPPLPMPRLSGHPANAPAPMAMPATSGVQTVLSPGLRQAAFAFDLPRAALPPAPGRVRCHVELDAAGRVSHLLMEKDDVPLDGRGVEAAVSKGRGAGPARGLVQVFWQ